MKKKKKRSVTKFDGVAASFEKLKNPTKRDMLAWYFQELVKYGSYGGLMNPYDYFRADFSRWQISSSPEICRANLWWFLQTHANAKIAIVDDRARSLEFAFTGIPLTHPEQLKKLGPAYRQWRHESSLIEPIWVKHKSRLSRKVHAGIKVSGEKVLLFNFCPFIPYFPNDYSDEREMEFKEQQITSKHTIKLLQNLKIPIIVLSKRGKKLADLSKINSTLLKFDRKDENWSKKLVELIKEKCG